jgi:hypothetical protein
MRPKTAQSELTTEAALKEGKHQGSPVSLRAILPHVCGMARSVRRTRQMLMMKAFFDEASDNTDDFLMGGWLASFDEWETFSEAWARELKFSPSIGYFNHNEALGLKDEFKGWSESDRDAKMMALAGVIARHNLIGLVGGIKIPQLASLFKNSVAPKRQLRSIIKFTEPYHHVLPVRYRRYPRIPSSGS